MNKRGMRKISALVIVVVLFILFTRTSLSFTGAGGGYTLRTGVIGVTGGNATDGTYNMKFTSETAFVSNDSIGTYNSSSGYIHTLESQQTPLILTSYGREGNKSLTALWLTNSIGNYTFAFEAPSSTGTYTIKVNSTTDIGIPGEQFASLTVTSSDADTTKPRINASINNSAPKRFETINISANVSDETALSGCQFISNMSPDGSKIYINTSVSGTADKCSQNFTVNFTRDNVINFTVIVNDTTNNKNQSESIVTVANTPPPQVVLRAPNINNNTINRTPTFSWFNVTDADNDTLLFNINIRCIGCSVDNRDANTTSLNYTPPELLNLYDDGYYYNWSVRAIDNSINGQTGYGNFSLERNITIESFISLTLLVGTVDFGNVDLSEYNDTLDNLPPPFLLENSGNVFANVSIWAADNLWDNSANPTEFFKYRAGNFTPENNSFNWSASITQFTTFPISRETANRTIADLNYSDANDSAELEISITVPLDEPPGAKQSKVVFEARRSR